MSASNTRPGAAAELARLQALLQAGRSQEAEAGYRQCLRDGVAQAAGPLATLLLQQERDGEAVELMEPLVRANPDDGEMAVNLSVALRRLGRREEAIALARRGCTLLPRAVPAWNALGIAQLESGDAAAALAAFESGLQAAGNHPALRLHRAMALRRLARNQESLADYAQLARAFPQALAAWRGLAEVQHALGQAQAALQSCQQAHRLAPQDLDVVYEFAHALFQAGRPADAARVLEGVVDRRNEHVATWVLLGRARLKFDLSGARVAFERARALDPDDVMVAHVHAALSGTLPASVETDYIRILFDDFAERFEHTLVGELAYDVPARLAVFLQRRGADTAASVLDLGCGTGLMAAALARAGRVIDGVDLSPRMLERAREKNLYRDLHAAEIGEFLRAGDSRWDLIVATDVYIYIPDAGATFAPAFARLAPGGWLAFSIETSAGADAELPPQTGRYRQAPARMLRDLAEAGFVDIAQESIVLRQESGLPVAGMLFAARRPVA